VPERNEASPSFVANATPGVGFAVAIAG